MPRLHLPRRLLVLPLSCTNPSQEGFMVEECPPEPVQPFS